MRFVDTLRRLLTGDHDQTAPERVIGRKKNQPRPMPVAEVRRLLEDA